MLSKTTRFNFPKPVTKVTKMELPPLFASFGLSSSHANGTALKSTLAGLSATRHKIGTTLRTSMSTSVMCLRHPSQCTMVAMGSSDKQNMTAIRATTKISTLTGLSWTQTAMLFKMATIAIAATSSSQSRGLSLRPNLMRTCRLVSMIMTATMATGQSAGTPTKKPKITSLVWSKSSCLLLRVLQLPLMYYLAILATLTLALTTALTTGAETVR